ncbi:type I secretion system permease/ATPase [Aeromonas simiae]|uniref:type I secretion system permease/ATPase n=1 Tax=Aeromonas simiae TaxID=218936 RepID=UPI0005A85E7E|nr:type I secretion system permease/ATPase [Aeromonas simiae]MDO2946798.1 type I secretion system permease/ATPase [Aeromonas simiae]MDO2951401.1 type I secretion system permease/ATPase [Aeromonas simiae]MDO2954608.1 type I secretion system permease/ATPase [Aeromonas simiae]
MQAGMAQQDELLEALVFLTRFYGVPNSRDALVTGLPLPSGRLSPALFPRAAERAGLAARQALQPLAQLSPLLLPCVLLLRSGGACILVEWDAEQGSAKVIFPQAGDAEQTLSAGQLEEEYTGQLFFVKKQFRFDARSPKVLETRHGHWFWSTLFESRGIYRDVLVASILINLFAIASPLFTMNVYDKIVPNLAFDSLWVLAVGAVVVFTFDFVMRQLRSYFIDVAGKKSDMLLSAKIFAKVMGMRMEARPASTGAFAKHLQEFESIREFFTSATVSTLIDLPFAFLFLFIIWIFAGPMVVVPLVAILILVIYSIYIQSPLKRSIEEGSRLASQKNANLIESIAGLETVKIFGAQSLFQYRWEQAVAHISTWGVQTRRITNSMSSLASYIQQMVTVGLIIVGVYQISDGNVTMGGMIAAVMLSSRAIAPMVQLSVLSTRYNQAKSALQILEQIMASPDEQEEGKQYVHHPVIEGLIEFDNVSFKYPGMETSTLHNINLRITPGEKVAIIGRIGAGKTTLEKLLMGLYRPSDGSVRLDGYELDQIPPSVLRRNIGCVPQDVTLFFGTVRDNIMLGNPLVDDQQVLRAAKRAGVTQFTNQDPNGLDKQIGEGGRQLSGGQRQAIVLARSLLNDPPVMVLDEPTSNMDNRSELQIKNELARLGSETTLLLITHKTSMLDVVNRVIVMEQGQIVADGPKEQVLQQLREGKVRVREMSNE